MQKELKNTIFRVLWKDLYRNFKDRISILNPKIVLNLCTGGKQSLEKYIENKKLSTELTLNILVHNAIKEVINSNTPYFYGVHPSCSSFAKSGFTKV